MNDWIEATMTVNGIELEAGHVMTIRVALESYASELHENGLGEDERGKAICQGYLKRIGQLRSLMGYGNATRQEEQ